MSTAPTQPQQPGSDRRRIIIAAVVIAAVALIVILLVAAWLFFFGSEAPDAPTLDDALKVLLPSASPE
jgi:hypothetical protein